MLMNRTQVEVRFTDKLDSIRVDQREMEIPNAIKEKPIEEWFEATTGRVKWGGLGAEIKDMDFSGEKNAAYSFLFNGPEDKKQQLRHAAQPVNPCILGGGSTERKQEGNGTGILEGCRKSSPDGE